MEAPGLVHTTLGATGLVLGAGIFLRPKGTVLHRAVGALYVLVLFGLNLTAFLIYRITGTFGVFHVFALINVGLVLAGFGAVLVKRPGRSWLRVHYHCVGYSYVGLLAAAAVEVAVRIPGWPFLPAVAVPTVTVTLVGGALVVLREHAVMAGLRRGRSVVE
jgi:uncharacterized membrane protein